MDADREQDERWMLRALELARGSVGLASPNPQVGCVLVRDGAVVGEGAHRYDELDHAEIVALKQAGEARARGATAYVTLEPCGHQGRTGPCADALIAAGVRRVVAATIDPNPRVSGQGKERLRAAGIEVSVGVLEREARALNDGFAKFVRTGRPLVVLKAAVSADGRIAPPVEARNPRQTYWITGAQARTEVQHMRRGADAVLTGIGTVLADDPLLTDRAGVAGMGVSVRRRPLLRVVLDSQLRMPLDAQLVRTAKDDLMVVCGEQADAARAAALADAGVWVQRIAGRDGRLDLGAVLDVLGERKILSVLLECGSQLNGAFLRAGLADEVAIFRSPKVLGAAAVPFAAAAPSLTQLEERMTSVSRVRFGEDVRVRGYLRDPWGGR
ncbi:MAG TPA: bifunctional diaminohydroxyphosphoribosylaminopyrimidine deaminase/5-amino-6-(5-phosphoribosylamino)uracil reductase RibD [Acidobacteriaceae bacterium]|nr:bifunctional diaminohydroxyphosphoribosylaminopyrimidine deaminase/5-amino-6-(5-phosphoribosylamino)uracil reductase RibD [Acidobacteriaceae bacterium]